MSPSESDLRAALRQGEEAGFQVNADAIVHEGQAIRARRVRIMSGAAIAVVVAAGAVGLAAARGGGGTSATANSNGSNVGGGARGDVVHNPRAVAPNATSLESNAIPVPGAGGGTQVSTHAQCPASAPHLLLPGGGGTGQFGADGALFAEPVKTLVVCSYEATTGSAPARLVLSARTATQVVASMENAPKATSPTPCDPGPTSTARLLDFIGVTQTGATLPPVTATVSFPACNVQVTNGTAVRSGWTPPASLTDQLRGLSPPKVPPRSVPIEPSGINVGTPIHS